MAVFFSIAIFLFTAKKIPIEMDWHFRKNKIKQKLCFYSTVYISTTDYDVSELFSFGSLQILICVSNCDYFDLIFELVDKPNNCAIDQSISFDIFFVLFNNSTESYCLTSNLILVAILVSQNRCCFSYRIIEYTRELK